MEKTNQIVVNYFDEDNIARYVAQTVTDIIDIGNGDKIGKWNNQYVGFTTGNEWFVPGNQSTYASWHAWASKNQTKEE